MATMYRSKSPLKGAMFVANPRRKRRVRRRKNTWFEGKTRDSKTGKLVARKHQKVARGGFRKSDRQRSWRDALKQASKDLTVKGPWKRSKRKKKVVGRGSHAEVSGRAVSLYSYSPMTAAEKRKQRKRKDAARRSKATSSKSRKSKSPIRTAPKRQAPALQPYVKGNPMRRRKNAKMQPIQKLMNWTKMVQDRVEKVPVARYVAWAIPAAALGWGVYYIHTAAAPKLVPALEKAPFVGGWVGEKPLSFYRLGAWPRSRVHRQERLSEQDRCHDSGHRCCGHWRGSRQILFSGGYR